MNGLLPHLVYDPPIAIVALLVVGGSLLSSLLLLLIFHRLLPVDLRSAHNDVAGFTIAIVGVIYAVLLAFIAVSAWETHGKAQEVVQMEANAVGNLYVDSMEAATSGIPAVMWAITLSGGALTIIFSFFFGMPDFRIHLAFSGILAVSLALVIVLMLALDRPFRGDLAISTERFEEISKGIVPAMKVDLQEVLAEGTGFHGMKPPEVTERLYNQFFSDLPRESFNSIVEFQKPTTNQ